MIRWEKDPSGKSLAAQEGLAAAGFPCNPDNDFGPKSEAALALFRAARQANPPDASGKFHTSGIPQAAIDLILEYEGFDQPSRWPGGDSGITLGHGFDLGFNTPAELCAAWHPHLDEDQLARLSIACAKTGNAARILAHNYQDIRISNAAADEVFHRITLPAETALTLSTFPGAETLPAAALGALVSLVFNRGPALTGRNRQDMEDIHDILADGVQTGDLANIARQFREMKSIWAGKGLDGLIRRREAEARLVESCIA